MPTIGERDNRHRKPVPIARAIERLMILDGVLADPTLMWLGTERTKRRYFIGLRGGMRHLRGTGLKRWRLSRQEF